MTVEHVDIADPEIHEPKNISIANNGEVYVASGGGTGTWQLIDWLDLGDKQITLNTRIDDISTASSAWVVCPYSGTITNIYSVIDGAIATADATLTAKLEGVSVTDGVITIANASSAAGDVDSAAPTALNAVTGGNAIEIATDGASTNTVSAVITFVITLD